MSKVIITCAVTGAIHTPSMSPYLPVTPEEIIEASVGAAEAGAAIIHLHARDPVTGKPDQSPEAFAKFHAAQGELSSALSRLLVVSENYPNLKANQGFQDLRVQLEGTENRITVARNRYIKAVQEYNVLSRSFPSNLTAMVFGYQPKANFSVADEAAISTPPKVDFGK